MISAGVVTRGGVADCVVYGSAVSNHETHLAAVVANMRATNRLLDQLYDASRVVASEGDLVRYR
jgi:hypothetical protein